MEILENDLEVIVKNKDVLEKILQMQLTSLDLRTIF